MFLNAVIIIAVISVVWALFSLRDFFKNPKVTKEVSKELDSGRVLFTDSHPVSEDYDSSSSSSSSSSSEGLE